MWLVVTILQGADRPERFAKWDRVLGDLPLLVEPDPRTAARAAAHLYAKCCWAGITLRSANDCLIAVHAVSNGVPLLHSDREFPLIATVEPQLVLLLVGSFIELPDVSAINVSIIALAFPIYFAWRAMSVRKVR
jgi:predicted nucleic acid-binding protein